MKRLMVTALVVCACVTLVGCGPAATAVKSTPVAGETLNAVPSVVGLDRAKAEETLAGAALLLGSVTESYDASAPVGTVASQVPASGATAAKRSAVDIVLSKGPAPSAVPKVKGTTQARAITLLEAAGFKVKVIKKNNGTKKGTVIAQNPLTGDAQRGTTVAITVSTGVDLVRVPSYRKFNGSYSGDDWNKELDSMIAAIKAGFRRAGLVASVEITSAYESEKDYQSPKAGSMVQRGTRVHIRIPVYD